MTKQQIDVIDQLKERANLLAVSVEVLFDNGQSIDSVEMAACEILDAITSAKQLAA
jgi:hypothetical protein